MTQIIFLLYAVLFNPLVQSRIPVRLGLKFPLRNRELAFVWNFMKQLSGSDPQIYRHLIYTGVIWSRVELRGKVWSFSCTDSIFLKTDYETESYKISCKTTLDNNHLNEIELINKLFQ